MTNITQMTEREILLQKLLIERFGELATRPEIPCNPDNTPQNYYMSLLDFVEQAPCRNLDPWLFDQYQLDLAQPALAICRNCVFWKECDALVKPAASHYDGIAAGKVWRNGNVLARLSLDSPYELLIGDEKEDLFDEETMAVRGSELLGN